MNRLKELRIKHDKTQREIAALLNVTPKAISFYELGQREIPNESLKVLADFFDVTTDFLLGRESLAVKEDHEQYTVNKDEHAFVEVCRKLSDDKRQAVLTLVKSMVDK
jgi:transcriptional regulator with XRE-family HTH domain